MKNVVKAGLITLLGVSAAFAGPVKTKKKADKLMAPGAYSAEVKGIVCSGCSQNIQQTLGKFKGIEKVAVDQDKKTVQFQIAKDAKVNLSEVQKALQESAGQMGMGADYQLRNLKKAG